jgi:hypothetical protein
MLTESSKKPWPKKNSIAGQEVVSKVVHFGRSGEKGADSKTHETEENDVYGDVKEIPYSLKVKGGSRLFKLQKLVQCERECKQIHNLIHVKR